MSTRPRRPSSRQPVSGTQARALYARTHLDLLTNEPDGFPSAYPPGMGPGGGLWWIGSDAWPQGLWADGMAPSLAVVRRATALICDPIAMSPMTVQAVGAFGAPQEQPTWLRDPMLTREDKRVLEEPIYPHVLRLGRSKWFGDLLRSALWYGLGAFIFQEDNTGAPLAGTCSLINPLLLSTERDQNDGSLRWVIGTGPDRAIFDRNGRLQLGPVSYRIAVLRNPASEVDQDGMSRGVFAMSPDAFRVEGQIEAYAASTFKSPVPAGYLKIDTPNSSQDVADELRASWLAHHGQGARSIAVLSSTVSFTPISLSPLDLGLAENKKLAIADVAFAFGIDPAMLGASLNSTMTYANQRDFFRQHRDLGLGIWVTALQDLLTSLVPGSAGVRVDLDAFTRPEPKERYEAYKVAIDAGVLLPDEARALEGLPPLPEPAPEPVSAPSLAPVPDTESEEIEARDRRHHAWRR